MHALGEHDPGSARDRRTSTVERFVEAFLIVLQISFFTTHYMEFVKCFTLQDSRNLKFRPKKRIHHDIFGEKIRMQDVSILNKSSIFVTAVTLWKLQPEFSKFHRDIPEQMDILHKKKIFYTNDICAKLAKINYYPGKKVFIF